MFFSIHYTIVFLVLHLLELLLQLLELLPLHLHGGEERVDLREVVLRRVRILHSARILLPVRRTPMNVYFSRPRPQQSQSHDDLGLYPPRRRARLHTFDTLHSALCPTFRAEHEVKRLRSTQNTLVCIL